jgi:hypothetical protein
MLDLGLGLTIAMMLLLSPLGWVYHSPLLFVTLVAAWYADNGSMTRPVKRMLVLAWLLSSVPSVLLPAATLVEPWSVLVWASLPFYALLAFNIVVAIVILRLRTAAPARAPTGRPS